MHHRTRFNKQSLHVANKDELEPTSEAGPPSPSSCDDTKIEEPSPKKRREMKKRVVTIPIGDVDGSKSKGENYPPSDSWAWRKYGQKPIKGSPYPRGYYRCSSSKGCPARKQVERSRVDPTKLLITYSHQHNHSLPLHKSNSTSTAAPASAIDHAASDSPAVSDAVTPTEERTVFASHPDLEFSIDSAVLLHHHYAAEFGWFEDVISAGVLESPISGVLEDVAFTMREEDEEESLFADLGELPECSTVFRRRNILSMKEIQCGGVTR